MRSQYANFGRSILCVSTILLLFTPAALAVTVEIGASQDTMIQADDDKGSNGAGVHFCVGRTGQPSTRRALMKFDIASAGIPPGSTIDAVTLRLYENEQAGGGTSAFTLHVITQDWGEGNSNAPDGECKGTSAELNDATWRYRFYDPGNEPGSPQWSSDGGDYVATASASTNVSSSNGNKFWSSTQMATDVQNWLNSPGTNFGWLLRRGSEGGSTNVIRYASRQNSNTNRRPLLTIDYTPPAVDGACCFPQQVCQTETAEDCGNLGGAFQGTGVSCVPNPCPPDPTGACCADDGTCTEVTEIECGVQAGTYQGDGELCSNTECPIILEPYVDALPIPAPAQPVAGSPGGTATYEIAMRELQQQLHRDLPPTTVWGYGTAAGASSFPGPTIEASVGHPVTVTWINDLRDTSQPGNPPPLRTDHYLEVDGQGPPPECTIHGAEDEAMVVVHLHGGHVPHEFDGYPEDAYVPGNQQTYIYPNNQEASTLWFHDHALGLTRLNVYMGLAGFYLLRDDFEDSLGLPACPDAGDPNTCFEIGLAIQDRRFNPDGSFLYPDLWQDHYFGDKMLVNGKIWPYLNVKQGKYRFRLLDGCNSRVLSLSFDRLDQPGTADLPFVQIGTEGGLMEAPLPLSEITLASGERADVVVDFSALPAGTEVLLTNSAPAPYPGNPGVGVVPEVMKFIVQDSPGHTDPIPPTLRPFEPIPESQAVRTRDFVLDKQNDACGSVWKMNGLGWTDITEYPQLGTTEIWRFINDGNTNHPMHMHLVFFNVLDRQAIGGGPLIPPDPSEIGWKDTAKALPNQITRVIAKFTDFPGRYAYHCHLLEHEDHEMMRQFWTVSGVDLQMRTKTDMIWIAQPGALSYDVVRGRLEDLLSTDGDFVASTRQCLEQTTGTSATTLGEPPLNEDRGYWYLIRQVDAGGKSTYDSGSSVQVGLRDAEIAASGVDCP